MADRHQQKHTETHKGTDTGLQIQRKTTDSFHMQRHKDGDTLSQTQTQRQRERERDTHTSEFHSLKTTLKTRVLHTQTNIQWDKTHTQKSHTDRGRKSGKAATATLCWRQQRLSAPATHCHTEKPAEMRRQTGGSQSHTHTTEMHTTETPETAPNAAAEAAETRQLQQAASAGLDFGPKVHLTPHKTQSIACTSSVWCCCTKDRAEKTPPRPCMAQKRTGSASRAAWQWRRGGAAQRRCGPAAAQWWAALRRLETCKHWRKRA